MKILDLNGRWQFKQSTSDEWLPATVPGGVHTDLMALDRIPDPFVGDNEKKVQWVAEANWTYRRQVEVEATLLNQPHVWLVCDGLDTLATVTLNGHTVGQTDNMFRQYRWDVKPLLQAGNNELDIHFASAVQYISEKQVERPLPGVSQAIPGGPYLRKAPCQFGWDWGPQLPPIGIWKDIRLEAGGVRLSDVHLRQNHADGQVTISAAVTLAGQTDEDLAIQLQIVSPDGEEFVVEMATSTALSTGVAPQIHNSQWLCCMNQSV